MARDKQDQASSKQAGAEQDNEQDNEQARRVMVVEAAVGRPHGPVGRFGGHTLPNPYQPQAGPVKGDTDD